MLTIYSNNDTFSVNGRHGEPPMVFFKNDIDESRRLLEYIVYSLGLNTSACKIEIKYD